MATTYDIYFTPLADTDISARPFSFGFVSSIGITGVRKLSNKFMKCLLTLKGSDQFDLLYGTGFISLTQYNISQLSDLIDSIVGFVKDAEQQITVAGRAASTPLNELLTSATLTSVSTTTKGSIVLVVTLKNAANELANLTLPALPARS